jgi:hypothetical protein
MAQRPVAAYGFLLAGVLFVAIGLLPLLRERPLNISTLAVGVVCVALGGALLRRFRGRSSGSP